MTPLQHQRGATTIFCDDIRREDSGKEIIIGVYGSDLIVPEPVVLPKLVIRVNAYTDADYPFKDFAIKILFDDQTLIHETFPADVWLSMVEKQSDIIAPSGAVKRFDAKFVLEIAPFKITKSGTLRVRILAETEEIRAGALTIRVG